MHGLTSGPATMHGFVRSAIMLARMHFRRLRCCSCRSRCEQSGSGGPPGLAIAAAICLVSGLAAEVTRRAISPQRRRWRAMLLGMMVRMVAAAGRLRCDPRRRAERPPASGVHRLSAGVLHGDARAGNVARREARGRPTATTSNKSPR